MVARRLPSGSRVARSPLWQTADDARQRELQEVRAAPPPRAGRPGRHAGRRVHPSREGAARTPAELRMLRRSPGAGPAPAPLLGDRLDELRALTRRAALTRGLERARRSDQD